MSEAKPIKETRAILGLTVNHNKKEKYAHVGYDHGLYSLYIHDPDPKLESDPECVLLSLTPEIARELAKVLMVSADFAEKVGVDQ